MSLINKIDRFYADTDIAHQIVHGGPTTTVTTEGGPVRSLAKLIADKDAEFDATDIIATVAADKNAVLAAKERDRILAEATLRLNYADNEYRVYEGLSGVARKTFAEAQTFTRVGDATGITATGRLATVGSNLPRLVGNRGGLLIEGQATNLLLWSEDFSNAVWDKSVFQSVSLVNVVNPFGGTQSWLAIPGTTNVSQSLALTTALPATHTKGIFAKAGGYRYFQLNWGSLFSATAHVNFDVLTGQITAEVGGAKGAVTDFGNGWFFLSATVTGTVPRTTAHGFTVVPAATSGRGAAMVGDGVSGMCFWGSQLETGSIATSYIKTEGAQVTRAADVCSRTLGAEYNPSEGTLYWEFVKSPIESKAKSMGFVGTHANTNRFVIFSDAASSPINTISASIIANGNALGLDAPYAVPGTRYKAAATFNKDVFAFYLNGVKIGQQANVVGAPVVTKLVGDNTSIPAELHRDIAYFPRALSEAELIALTTL